MEATTDIYLDPRVKANGKFAVKIKITHNRKRKYTGTGIDLSSSEFEKLMFPEKGERLKKEQKNIKTKLYAYKAKADNAIKGLKIFTFDGFEKAYFESRDVYNDVSFGFDDRIHELRENGKIGTAVTYECAKNSLLDFEPKLTFAEVTPKLLRKYEKWMVDKGRSITTVSMYLRSLRALFNNQDIDQTLYPFAKNQNDKGKYSIPAGRNEKKALTLEEVAKIYNYEPETDAEEMARDYWMFLYLCNGMNVKDVCLLKWGNIDGEILKYDRAKTTNTKKKSKPITVSLKLESKAIIRKWGVPSLNKTAFIFPHFEAEMTPEDQKRVCKQLTKTINKYIKRITKKLEIAQHVTTYSARHSFATVLKRSGTNIAMISDLLGHSNLSVTQNYLDSFEDDKIKEQTDALTKGFKTAN